MKKRLVLSLFFAVLISSCAPTVKSNFVDTSNSLMLVDKIACLNLYDVIPGEAVKIGQAKYGDSGVSTDCGCRANLLRAKELAAKNKANIVKIVKIKRPNSFSSCCRMEVEFYHYDGDVSKLDQIKEVL